ncbi:MAG: FeoA family protein [Rectinemataceae bacterium]
MTLSDIAPGSGFTVSRVKISGETGKRLADMGFTEGAGGFMVRGAFMRGPLQVRIRGYDLLMRRGEAACLEVEEAPAATAATAPNRPVAGEPKPVRPRRGPGGGLRRFFAADDCCGGGSGRRSR